MQVPAFLLWLIFCYDFTQIKRLKVNSMIKIKFLEKLKSKRAVSMIAVILGLTIGAVVTIPITKWVIGLNAAIHKNADDMTVISVAYDQWNRIIHEGYEKALGKANTTETLDNIMGGRFTAKIEYGKRGLPQSDGSCRPASGTELTQAEEECLPTTISVYRKGESIPAYISSPTLVSSDDESLPYGTILPYVGNVDEIPIGWALCDGTNDTPDLRGRVLQGYDAGGEVREFKEAGLPNITGRVSGNLRPQQWGGAFKVGGNGPQGNRTSGDGGWFYFDASWSNPIYGNSNTVQPPAYTVMYIMRVKGKSSASDNPQIHRDEYYTKEQIDNLLKHYVGNQSWNSGTMELGYNGKSIDAYFNGERVPLGEEENTDPELFSDDGGYYKFPNGLIMQWGIVYARDFLDYCAPSKDCNFFKTEFPIPFPNKVLSATGTIFYPDSIAGEMTLYISKWDNHGMSGLIDHPNNYWTMSTAYPNDGGVSWFAIGY